MLRLYNRKERIAQIRTIVCLFGIRQKSYQFMSRDRSRALSRRAGERNGRYNCIRIMPTISSYEIMRRDGRKYFAVTSCITGEKDYSRTIDGW